MNNQHPITLPPELMQQWLEKVCSSVDLLNEVAQWGADQELQACINFVYDNELCDPDFYNNLRTARRPNPPSDTEQALTALQAVVRGAMDIREQHQNLDTIRRTLERLQKLEEQLND